MGSARLLQTTAVLLFFILSACFCFEYCSDRAWLKFQDHCYTFQSRSDEKNLLSYYDAENYCRARGAHLVSIHSKEENDFIIEAMNKNYYGGRQWIGLNTLQGHDDFRWSDGTTADYLKLVNKTEYFKESCFVFYKSEGGWRREHCELRHTAICKKSVHDVDPVTLPPITPPVPTGNCPQDWLQFGQKCYKYFGAKESERKQFKEAKLACMGLGENHDLVSIHSPEEQAFLTQNLYGLGVSAWIGFNQISSDEIGHILVFGWTDNSQVNYTYWAPGHPQRGTWKNCVALGYNGIGKGEWIANYCAIDKKGYICQRPPAAELPPRPPKPSGCEGDAVRYRNSCYTFHGDQKTWVDANSTCRSEGGYLLSVTDSFEQAFLFNFVKQNLVWTGLRSIENTSILQWSDREPFYYSNWANGQPLVRKDSSCAFMDGKNGLTWKMSTCQDKLPFVCESSSDVPPVHPPTFIGKCPSQESTFVDIGDKYCYHIAEGKNDRLQWGSLSRYCLSKGMEMITVHREHQVKSLMTYLWKKPYDYWLGLIRSFDRKSFIWTDNSPMNYTNWAEREPSSWSSDKDCAGFSTRDSTWSVKDCSDWNGSICRAKKL